MDTVRLTVAQAIVRFLASQYSVRDGVEQRAIAGVWAIFGHGNVAGLGQALHELGDEVGLRTYRPQNEQAMVHLAAAYARHKDRLSTFACTASVGPGSTNMLTAAAGATINRLPVLLLPSDYFANRLPDPVLQQLEHPNQHDVSVNDAFRPVSRFFARLTRPEQALSALPEAMRMLFDPVETGAVTVSLPEDVQAEAWDWPTEFFRKRLWRVRRPVPDPEALEDAVSLLMGAESPLVIAGGGVVYSGASAELRRFVEAFGVPVVETQAGKGALAWDHELNAGPLGANGGLAANALARDADVILCAGTRLGDFVTASKTAFQHPKVRFIGLNVSPMDSYKLSAAPLIADAKVALEALAGKLEERGFRGFPAAYRARAADLAQVWRKEVAKVTEAKGTLPLAQAEVIGKVNEVFGHQATVICAAGSMPGDLLKLWRADTAKAYHVEYGYSCMGYEIPAGLGVRLAEPERDVVVMIGDGSYLMLSSEIVTAVAERMRLTVVVVDNHGFQSIHGLQQACGTPEFNNELRFRDVESGKLTGATIPVDFAAHARAMGARASVAEDEESLLNALHEAQAFDGVTVVVALVDPTRRVPNYGGWWDVPVAQETRQQAVAKARSEYEEAQRTRRFLG